MYLLVFLAWFLPLELLFCGGWLDFNESYLSTGRTYDGWGGPFSRSWSLVLKTATSCEAEWWCDIYELSLSALGYRVRYCETSSFCAIAGLTSWTSSITMWLPCLFDKMPLEPKVAHVSPSVLNLVVVSRGSSFLWYISSCRTSFSSWWIFE